MDLREWRIFASVDQSANNAIVFDKIKFALVFGVTGRDVLYVTEDDELFVLGPNHLTGTSPTKRKAPRIPQMVLNMSYKEVIGLCGGEAHVVALTASGEVYAWGSNYHFSVARGSECRESTIPPGIVSGLVGLRVKEVACGTSHTLALTDQGLVYGWGYNKFGQIGCGGTVDQDRPRKVSVDRAQRKKFIKIACQALASFAVNEDGEVFSWGMNSEGQLGIGNDVDQDRPMKVDKLSGVKITNIVGGYHHTLALSDEGKVYAWGKNDSGQLGIFTEADFSAEPVQTCCGIENIVDIAAIFYSHISAAMTANSRVYMWGYCQVTSFCTYYSGETVFAPLLTQFHSLHQVFAHYSLPSVSYKQMMHIPPQTEEQVNLLNSLEYALDDETTSDLSLKIGDDTIRVHSGILKIRSAYLRTMLREPWRDGCSNVVTISTKTYPVYKAYLNYLYSGRIEILQDKIFDLLDLATEYCETDLVQKCERMIKFDTNIENVALVYAKSVAIQNEEMQDFCLRYTTNHTAAVLETAEFSNLTADLMKSFLLKVIRRGGVKQVL